MPFLSHPRYIQGKLMFLLFIKDFIVLLRNKYFAYVELRARAQSILWLLHLKHKYSKKLKERKLRKKFYYLSLKGLKHHPNDPIEHQFFWYRETIKKTFWLTKPLLGGISIDMNVLSWSADWKAPGFKNVQMAVLHLL